MDDVDMSTEPENPPEPASDASADPEPSETPPAPETGSDAQARSREAATYRTRLHEAEAVVVERDAAIGGLRDEVDRLHRVEAERLAGDALASPSDLWLVADLAQLRDDAGRLDSEKGKETITNALADRPAWRKPGVGFEGGARRPAPATRTPGARGPSTSGITMTNRYPSDAFDPIRPNRYGAMPAGWPRSPVVNPHRPPWQQAGPLPFHVARTDLVAWGPGLLRAADAGASPKQ